MILQLSLSKYRDHLRISKKDEKLYIYCVIRRKDLVLQPEEMVRQLILTYFIEEGIYPTNKIQVEKKVNVNGLAKRFDIVVYDQKINPFLLVECKSHKINIDQNTMDQVSRYNIAMEAPYLLISNGINTICAEIDFKSKSTIFLDQLPVYPT